jgi:hypothetical protein
MIAVSEKGQENPAENQKLQEESGWPRGCRCGEAWDCVGPVSPPRTTLPTLEGLGLPSGSAGCQPF